MSADKRRIPTWIVVLVLAPGLLVTVVMGLWAYMTMTATQLHPNAAEVSSVPQTVPSREWTEAVEQARQVVRAELVAQNLPGASVAVGVGQHLVWAEGFGWADLEHQVPVAPDTRFRIGTASVVLTAAAAGLLLEQGRLQLDAPIQTWVPAFPEAQWPVTLRQVMGHTAGIRNDGGDEGPLLSQACARPVEGVERIASYPLLYEPGTAYRYSSYGWILVSAAIEAAADEPFLMFIRRHIFEPLGMRDTLPDSAADSVAGRATPYFPRFAADPRYGPDLTRPIDHSCYAGASVFLSTSSDLVRFMMGISGGDLLQPSTVQELQLSQRLVSGEETGYGLGWIRKAVDLAGTPTYWVGHGGTVLGGTVASLMMLPEYGIVVSIISNTSYADTESLGVRIAEAFAAVQR
jgi:serine beta-lactamase-like protein LACTB